MSDKPSTNSGIYWIFTIIVSTHLNRGFNQFVKPLLMWQRCTYISAQSYKTQIRKERFTFVHKIQKHRDSNFVTSRCTKSGGLTLMLVGEAGKRAAGQGRSSPGLPPCRGADGRSRRSIRVVQRQALFVLNWVSTSYIRGEGGGWRDVAVWRLWRWSCAGVGGGASLGRLFQRLHLGVKDRTRSQMNVPNNKWQVLNGECLEGKLLSEPVTFFWAPVTSSKLKKQKA